MSSGDEIIKAMQEAIEWSKGNTTCRVTQFECGACGAELKTTREVKRDELPLLCPECEDG